MAPVDLGEAFRSAVPEAENYLLFYEDGTVAYTTIKPAPDMGVLSKVRALFGGRSEAIASGLDLEGTTFEVYAHHPPRIYGRSAAGDPSVAPAFAVRRVGKGANGTPAAYALVTFRLPALSSEIVPKLDHFCEHVLGASGIETA